jgi:hypothetical protein
MSQYRRLRFNSPQVSAYHVILALLLLITDAYFRCSFVSADSSVVSDTLIDLLLKLNKYYSRLPPRTCSNKSRDSSVGIALGYWLVDRGSRV